MADTAHKSGGSLSGAENPTAAQKLLDDSVPASGITKIQPAPSLVPDWEGDEVLAARVTIFKALPSTNYTQNPIHSSKADPIPPEDDPSVSGHSEASYSQVSRKSHRTPTQSEADALSEIGRLTDEEQEEVRSYKSKPKKNGRREMNAPRVRKSGGSMTSQNMARLSAEHAYSERVAARFFTRHLGSNTYRVRKRDGLIFDNGTHYKKGAYLSEDSAMTFIAAVIERQPASERDAAMARLFTREARTSSPSPPRTNHTTKSSKDAQVPGAPGDPDDESDGSTSNSSHNQITLRALHMASASPLDESIALVVAIHMYQPKHVRTASLEDTNLNTEFGSQSSTQVLSFHQGSRKLYHLAHQPCHKLFLRIQKDLNDVPVTAQLQCLAMN